MFFYLSKILLFLLRPLVWGIALLLLAWFTKDIDKRKKRLVAAIVVLYLFSNSFLLNEVLVLYEPKAVNVAHKEYFFETGIVLCGFANKDDGNNRIVFYEASDRLLQAVSLYKQGKIEKILLSGGSGSIEAPEKKESVFIKEYLLDIGIPDSAILIESNSRNTAENAIYTKKLLDSLYKGTYRHLLITSAMHMPRAEACFSKAGVTYMAYPVNHAGSAVRDKTIGNILLPNTRALYTWELLIKEWVGLAAYKITGKS